MLKEEEREKDADSAAKYTILDSTYKTDIMEYFQEINSNIDYVNKHLKDIYSLKSSKLGEIYDLEMQEAENKLR
jgi:hypothetical protein